MFKSKIYPDKIINCPDCNKNITPIVNIFNNKYLFLDCPECKNIIDGYKYNKISELMKMICPENEMVYYKFLIFQNERYYIVDYDVYTKNLDSYFNTDNQSDISLQMINEVKFMRDKLNCISCKYKTNEIHCDDEKEFILNNILLHTLEKFLRREM